MPTVTFEAKLRQGVRALCVDKNISANLSAGFSVGNYNRPIQANNLFVITPNILAQRIKKVTLDLVAVSSVSRTDQRYQTYGGGNNVITPGSPRVIDNTNNWKVVSSLVCKFPTYIEIDIEKLGLPEGTDCIVQFEEGFVLEDRGRQLASGAYEYPLNVQNAPNPPNSNFVTFRTPWFGLSFMTSTFTRNIVPLRIRPLSSTLSSTASVVAYPIFNPGKLAALFGGVFLTSSNVSKIAVSASALQSTFSSNQTILKIKQLLSDVNSEFNLSLPEFDIVIDFAAGLAGEFTKTISSATSRIRYLFNQSLTSTVELISNTANSRRRNTSSTVNAVSSMSSALTPTITQVAVAENPSNLTPQAFGSALAFDGTNIVVGDSLYQSNGRVYVFSSVTGSLIRTISNPNASLVLNQEYDNFGDSVAVYGNYAVIGAPQEDGPNSSYKGAAYVIDLPTGVILYTLTNPNNSTDYYFGRSVAINDTYVVIGQQTDAVIVYSLSTGQILRSLTVDTSLGYRFYTVDISGDNIIVGTQRVTYDQTDTYRLYQYSASTGSLIRTINNPNPYSTEYGDQFGSSVAVYGNYAVVGAPGEDISATNEGSNVGKAYIFNLTNGSLVHTLTNPDPQQYDGFGSNVDLNHRYAIIRDNNQVHIFNISDGSREATVAVSLASKVAIYGNKFAVTTGEVGTSTTGKVRVFSF